MQQNIPIDRHDWMRDRVDGLAGFIESDLLRIAKGSKLAGLMCGDAVDNPYIHMRMSRIRERDRGWWAAKPAEAQEALESEDGRLPRYSRLNQKEFVQETVLELIDPAMQIVQCEWFMERRTQQVPWPNSSLARRAVAIVLVLGYSTSVVLAHSSQLPSDIARWQVLPWFITSPTSVCLLMLAAALWSIVSRFKDTLVLKSYFAIALRSLAKYGETPKLAAESAALALVSIGLFFVSLAITFASISIFPSILLQELSRESWHRDSFDLVGLIAMGWLFVATYLFLISLTLGSGPDGVNDVIEKLGHEWTETIRHRRRHEWEHAHRKGHSILSRILGIGGPSK